MAKAVAEEVRRQFVVLPVGGIGVHRQCPLAQRAQALRQQCRLRLLPARGLVTQSLRAQPADTGTDQHIGQQAALSQAQQAGSGPVGRQFDFLCQELNRETNTLCSKSADIDLTRIGLDLKATVEQVREQVQNIE